MKEESLKIKNAVEMWLDKKIDELLSKNPQSALFQRRLKKGIKEIIMDNVNFDVILPFLTDDNGYLNVSSLKDELMQGLRDLHNFHHHFGNNELIIDNNKIMLRMPDNIITSLFLGGINEVTLTVEDINELFNIMEKERF